MRPIRVGARDKYRRTDILRIMNGNQTSEAPIPAEFNVFSSDKIQKIELEQNVFDLRGIDNNTLGPYGVLSLLCELLTRAKTSKEKIRLLIDDNSVCRYLKSIGFLNKLETRSNGNILWDKNLLSKTRERSDKVLLPISPIRVRKGEVNLLNALIQKLTEQGFKEDVRSYFGTILGELADNSMTHSKVTLEDKICYFLVERFFVGDLSFVIIGIADMGLGIHNSLLTNPKHQQLTAQQSFLSAFRPLFSSWNDEAKRGKGLTDVLSIAMGNRSYLKVDSCELSYFIDFRNKQSEEFYSTKPTTKVNGTRFGIVLFDKEFDAIDRKLIDNILIKALDKI